MYTSVCLYNYTLLSPADASAVYIHIRYVDVLWSVAVCDTMHILCSRTRTILPIALVCVSLYAAQYLTIALWQSGDNARPYGHEAMRPWGDYYAEHNNHDRPQNEEELLMAMLQHSKGSGEQVWVQGHQQWTRSVYSTAHQALHATSCRVYICWLLPGMCSRIQASSWVTEWLIADSSCCIVNYGELWCPLYHKSLSNKGIGQSLWYYGVMVLCFSVLHCLKDIYIYTYIYMYTEETPETTPRTIP